MDSAWLVGRNGSEFSKLTDAVASALKLYILTNKERTVLFLLAALAISLGVWPVVVFHRHLTFDPARFTEEWIKLWAQGTFLLVAAWLINKKLDSQDRFRFSSRVVAERLKEPIERGLEELASFHHEKYRTRHNELQILLEELLDEQLAHEHRSELRSLRAFMASSRLGNLLDSYSHLTPEEKAECDRLLAGLRERLHAVLRLIA